jgi:RimJ/RimL family protein N-acetyltransferase
MSIVIKTERLYLQKISEADAPFFVDLLNQPSFIANIGDKKVRNEKDAVAYLRNGPLSSYERFGFGPWLIVLKETETAIGMSGLIKRDVLEDPDLGYALLPDYWSKGYASEAAAAILEYAVASLGMKRVAAVVNPTNDRSIRLLEKLGFVYERMMRLNPDDAEVRLLIWTPPIK